MFVDEQMARSVYDYKSGIREEHWAIERSVWSPVSCRWTNWTYAPKVWASDREGD